MCCGGLPRSLTPPSPQGSCRTLLHPGHRCQAGGVENGRSRRVQRKGLSAAGQDKAASPPWQRSTRGTPGGSDGTRMGGRCWLPKRTPRRDPAPGLGGAWQLLVPSRGSSSRGAEGREHPAATRRPRCPSPQASRLPVGSAPAKVTATEPRYPDPPPRHPSVLPPPRVRALPESRRGRWVSKQCRPRPRSQRSLGPRGLAGRTPRRSERGRCQAAGWASEGRGSAGRGRPGRLHGQGDSGRRLTRPSRARPLPALIAGVGGLALALALPAAPAPAGGIRKGEVGQERAACNTVPGGGGGSGAGGWAGVRGQPRTPQPRTKVTAGGTPPRALGTGSGGAQLREGGGVLGGGFKGPGPGAGECGGRGGTNRKRWRGRAGRRHRRGGRGEASLLPPGRARGSPPHYVTRPQPRAPPHGSLSPPPPPRGAVAMETPPPTCVARQVRPVAAAGPGPGPGPRRAGSGHRVLAPPGSAAGGGAWRRRPGQEGAGPGGEGRAGKGGASPPGGGATGSRRGRG